MRFIDELFAVLRERNVQRKRNMSCYVRIVKNNYNEGIKFATYKCIQEIDRQLFPQSQGLLHAINGHLDIVVKPAHANKHATSHWSSTTNHAKLTIFMDPSVREVDKQACTNKAKCLVLIIVHEYVHFLEFFVRSHLHVGSKYTNSHRHNVIFNTWRKLLFVT